MTAALPAEIGIVEVGPRDGLQNESALLSTATKVELIERSIAAGARRVEAVSFAHPRLVPQMADAEDVLAAAPQRDDVEYSGLVLNRRGFDRALAAGVREVNVVVVATDEFSRRNQGVTTEEGLRVWEEIAAAAHAAGVRPVATIAVAFGCPFEGAVSSRHVIELARRIADSGPFELALADTIGAGVPTQVQELIGGIREITDVSLRCHFHNTRNTGYANSVAAIRAGAAALDASVGGIGGCPFAPNATGNIATEDLEYLLSGMGVDTGLDLAALSATGTWIGEQLGKEVPALLGKAGPFPG
ncbi:hydroxymethylglutaryl-CoA lyase [Saccharopolyspora griseoalba]|uniref:Hydroxymethylglutaryl-CoA lyase n=1 Tax=Saccharopolyspora griseoalba TaxID=1431848 RepID=A0ABW2LT01_9PSEU